MFLHYGHQGYSKGTTSEMGRGHNMRLGGSNCRIRVPKKKEGRKGTIVNKKS